MLERIRTAERDEGGFTLIELLIVIVILGVLASVVVFAVNGIQDRGKASACKADVQTVTIAAEAYKAQNANYAESMEQLVSAGLLHSVPSSNNYTIDYSADNDSTTPSVNVSSSYCPSPGSSPSSSSPSTGPVSSDSAADIAAYCAEARSAGKRLNELRNNPYIIDQWRQVLEVYEALAAASTSTIRPDWEIFVASGKSARDIIAATGLSQADLEIALYNQVPDGYSRAQLDQLRHDLQVATGSGAIMDASSRIGNYRVQYCEPS